MKIHKFIQSKNITNYYFTKSKWKCVMVEYDKTMDFGYNSASGTYFRQSIIHYNNAFITKDFIEITISDVPKPIQDLLSYLSN
jgi:hypothetical protein